MHIEFKRIQSKKYEKKSYILIDKVAGEYCSNDPRSPCYGKCATGLTCGSSIFTARHLPDFQEIDEPRREKRGGYSYGTNHELPPGPGWNQCQKCVKNPCKCQNVILMDLILCIFI